MALQDLTPQLRTRLSHVERTVGVFVVLATLLLLTGFVYYVYHTIQRKGWLVPKANYYTMLRDASGIKPGDHVMLMGFDAGEVTGVDPNDPNDFNYNVTITFQVKKPYYGYIWEDSEVKVEASGLLGGRSLVVTKGGTGPKDPNHPERKIHATYLDTKNQDNTNGVLRMWVEYDPEKKTGSNYVDFATYPDKKNGYWLAGYEAPPMAEQVSKLIAQVGDALPHILSLTNQVQSSLSNSASLMVALNNIIQGAQPVVTNLAVITTQLRNPKGSLGDWMIPTQINEQLQGTLSTTSNTIYAAQTNLNLVVSNLNRSLDSVAGITANLRQQVQANSLMLTEISSLVVNADDFLQGLKRNWLLKKSFNVTTNRLPQSILKPGVGGAP